MFVSFVWFALAVVTFFVILTTKPWYYAAAIGLCVFFGGAVARSLFGSTDPAR